MSTGNYTFVVTQKPFQHPCDACESCYSCDSSPRTGVAPHAFRSHPCPGPRPLRFVTACQQVLALAVVCAALTPGPRRDQPRRGGGGSREPGGRYLRGADGGLRPGGAEDLEAPERPGHGPPARGRRSPGPPGRPARRSTRRAGWPRPRPRPGSRSRPAAAPASPASRSRSSATAPSASPGPTASRCRARTCSSRRPHPHRRHLVGLGDARVRRRPRPRPGQRRGSARPPRHRPAAGRSRRPGPGPGRRPALPADRHEARGGRPRQGRSTPSSSVRRSTPAPWTATTARAPPTTPRRCRRPRQDAAQGDLGARGGDVHAAAGDLLAGPVGRQREHARQELAALLRGARRLRPPHGQRQRLHARRGARHPAEHLRVPHAVPRLERHRLQLPRRQVRPHLGGPVRRRRPPRRRRAHAQLQRLLVRDVGDRQLRDRPAARGDAAGVRRAVRLEAEPARRRPRPRPSSGWAASGSRPSTGTATPPRRPVRASTSTRRSR